MNDGKKTNTAEDLGDEMLDDARGGFLLAPHTIVPIGGARHQFYAGSEEEPMAIKADTRQFYAGSEEEPMALKPRHDAFFKD
ncbi:MAG: hypothetical protein AAF409_17495 [Pseudomonadota bacterium]